MSERQGGCLCGAIRWRATVSPFWSAHCHCASCRKTTGAPLTSYLAFSKASVAWHGQRSFRASSPGATRGFCPDCSTALSLMSTRWPGELYVPAATLDDLTLFAPEAHVFWADRVPWLSLNDDLPKYDGRAPSALPSQMGERP